MYVVCIEALRAVLLIVGFLLTYCLPIVYLNYAMPCCHVLKLRLDLYEEVLICSDKCYNVKIVCSTCS